MVVGGGAAGFFSAIACAEAAPGVKVVILERGSKVLEKVRISGGGRCNVTHACFDTREFSTRYPRGGRALIGLFERFSARETIDWFAGRGVELKAEPDGRMFPVTNDSSTIVNCLTWAARSAGVDVRINAEVVRAERTPDGRFTLGFKSGETLQGDRLVLALGGCRTLEYGALAVGLGHTLVPPAPSLFAFNIDCAWLRELPGVSLPKAVVSAPEAGLEETGPILITHLGLSGPAILRLSAWGARALQERGYQFALKVNWAPDLTRDQLMEAFRRQRTEAGARTVARTPLGGVVSRLWEQLVCSAGLPAETRWSSLTRTQATQLAEAVQACAFRVTGKTMNKDEFVTCGGVPLGEVNFKTMESRKCPGLHFAGEFLDIDGITGGFNFQAAWATGFVAGTAAAQSLPTAGAKP
jgi:predicted Rossmann fold flavoprotein